VTRRYQDYLTEDDDRVKAAEDWRRVSQLQPVDPDDKGTVFVSMVKGGNQWTASWQRGGEHCDIDGTEEEVLNWARAHVASHDLILSEELDEWVPLDT